MQICLDTKRVILEYLSIFFNTLYEEEVNTTARLFLCSISTGLIYPVLPSDPALYYGGREESGWKRIISVPYCIVYSTTVILVLVLNLTSYVTKLDTAGGKYQKKYFCITYLHLASSSLTAAVAVSKKSTLLVYCKYTNASKFPLKYINCETQCQM